MQHATAAEHLEAGRAAFARGEWTVARERFAAALALGDDPEAREGLSWALFWEGRASESFEHRLRAFEGFRRRGDLERAATLAACVAADYRIAGNASLARGWLARAGELAARIEGDCPAHFWLAVERAKSAAVPVAAEAHAREALAVARGLGDGGLEAAALSHVGRALIAQGRADEGADVLDQAMATAVSATWQDPLGVSDACCTTLVACEWLADARRARDWSAAVVDFTRRSGFTVIRPWCGAVHAGFLVRTGHWEQADRELERILAEGERLRRADRLTLRVTLAALRVRQGRLPEAARLLDGAEDHPGALDPLVHLHLAEGDVALAQDRVERRLTGRPDPPALALRAEVRLARGDAAGAGAAAEELAAAARRASRDDLVAVAAVLAARAGRLAGARADAAALERAVATLGALALPLEQGEARAELARALADEHPALAVDHARAALGAFERLGAARHADAAAALLRDLGAPGRPAPRTADVLTRREQEVLELLGEGLSNAGIAERLVISPRTAEHHVRAVLRKLDLRSRAEAAAYAARAGA